MEENTSQYKKELAEIDQALDLQTEAISRISKSQLMAREKIFQMELAQKKFTEVDWKGRNILLFGSINLNLTMNGLYLFIYCMNLII